jgi:eukaryotic-like serine/threonine-protein kinase
MPTAPKDSPPLEGSLIAGKYRVTREIGRGGMAFVYEGLHADIQKRVAIKILSAEFITSQVVVERFLREARAAAAVRSPYICDVYDSGKLDDGRPFLVMELLEGESLYERMVRVRLFDPDTTVRVITHAARGLAKAHAAGIVHRDLKPENIFLTTNEEGQLEAKILDFGLAKFYAPVDGEGQTRLTREGAIFGTPAYMSPEQVKGQGAVDHRADVWALGCIVYECFTGRTVWSTEQGVAMTFAQIASSPIPKISKYRPDLPPTIDPWFDKALCRDIDKRFQTPKELAEGLAIALDTGPLSTMSQSAPSLRIPSLAPMDADPPMILNPPDPMDTLGSLAPPISVDGNGPASGRRGDAPSIVETGTSHPVLAGKPGSRRRSWPFIAVGVGVVVSAGAILAVTKPWHKRASEQPIPANSSGAAAASAGSAEPFSTTSASAGSLPAASANLPKWVTSIASAQAQLATGDLDGATRGFKEAFDSSGTAPARTLMEHANATAGNKGPCRLSGVTRLRPWTLTAGTVSRPVLLRTSRGYLALWTDDHEAIGHDHAYSLVLDDNMRATGAPVDVTPEADDLGKFTAARVDDRVLLLYADSKGASSGLFMRWLDASGTIAGPGLPVAPARAANAHPTIAVGQGTHWALWDEDRDADGSDLFARKLEVNGATGSEVRVTDFVSPNNVKTKISGAQAALVGSSLELIFRLERDVARPVIFVHIADPSVSLKEGLGDPVPGHRTDRAAGTMKTLTPEKDRGDAPSIACASDGCFIAWHGEKVGTSTGGGYAGFVDSKSGQLLWRKKFVVQGGKPSVGMGPKGAGAVAWFEQGRVRLAPMGREGVGVPSVLARVAGDQPRPAVAMGATSKDWGVAWLDFEAGKLEPYALSASCP